MVLFDKGIVLFICIIEVFLLFDYFNNFFEIKIKKNLVKYVCIITCVLLFLINILGNVNTNLPLVVILLWLFVTVLFDCRFNVRIGYYILAYVVMIGVEFLYAILSHTTYDMVSSTGVIPVSDYGWQALFVKFCNFIVFILLKQHSKKSKSRMTDKLFFTYLSVPIITVGMMLTLFYSGIDIKGHPLVRVVMTVFFIAMILANMILFYSFQRYTEKTAEAVRQQMELVYKNNEIERLSKITEMNETYNETVHNISHSLKVIEQLAAEDKNEEIREVIEQLTGKMSRKNMYEYSNHKLLNTILSEYRLEAEKKKIDFDIYVEPGCRLKQISDIDFVSMIGNLFDNAIEASEKVDKPMIKTRIFMHKEGEMCLIKVENKFSGEIKMVNERVISNKIDEGIHGIGLLSVQKTAEKYNGCFSYYTEDDMFISVLMLPIK